MKLSIIVPVYNEEKTIKQVLQKLAGLDFGAWETEIIVVDDGSEDNSKGLIGEFSIQNSEFRILEHEANQGKGSAIQTALKHVTGEAVVIQDADLEYEPEEIRVLLEKFEKDKVVYGSRNLEPKRRGYSLYVFGVWLLTQLVNLFYGGRLTDVYTCYKLFPARIIKNLNLTSRGFEFEMEATVKLLKRGIKITEVPISYSPRKFAQGKKIRARDGLLGMRILLKNYFTKRN